MQQYADFSAYPTVEASRCLMYIQDPNKDSSFKGIDRFISKLGIGKLFFNDERFK